MSLPSRASEIYRNEGITSLLLKGKLFIQNKLEKKYYSLLSWMKSPVEYCGVSIPVSHKSFNNGARRQILQEDWETEEILSVNHHFDDESDFIELGACTGFLTTYILNKFNDGVNAVAVEANPELIPLIKETRRINRKNFDIINSAYNTQTSHIEFSIFNKIESGSIQNASDEKITVSTININTVLNKYDLENPVIISDIEGAEVDLISNELSLLESNCPLLIIEFHDSKVEGINEAKKKLKNSNFELIDTIKNIGIYYNDSVD